jgi:hypothetical protein
VDQYAQGQVGVVGQSHRSSISSGRRLDDDAFCRTGREAA